MNFFLSKFLERGNTVVVVMPDVLVENLLSKLPENWENEILKYWVELAISRSEIDEIHRRTGRYKRELINAMIWLAEFHTKKLYEAKTIADRIQAL